MAETTRVGADLFIPPKPNPVRELVKENALLRAELINVLGALDRARGYDFDNAREISEHAHEVVKATREVSSL